MSDPAYVFLFFSNFTQLPHLAGTKENMHLAQQVQAEWEKFGLDSVQLVHYDVLLSYPDETNPNYISIIDEDGNEVQKPPVFQPENKIAFIHPKRLWGKIVLCSLNGGVQSSWKSRIPVCFYILHLHFIIYVLGKLIFTLIHTASWHMD